MTCCNAPFGTETLGKFCHDARATSPRHDIANCGSNTRATELHGVLNQMIHDLNKRIRLRRREGFQRVLSGFLFKGLDFSLHFGNAFHGLRRNTLQVLHQSCIPVMT